MIITVSGKPGSGKSTIGKELADTLGYAHVSAGDFMRELAAERDMTVLELSRIAEQSPEIDKAIDERSTRFGDSTEDLVIDARLAWYFIPDSVKVFLDVSLDEAARRIYGAGRTAEKENVDLESTRRNIERRTLSESQRYLSYYDVDYLDLSHYDLVIDTSQRSVEEIVALITDYVSELRRPSTAE